MHKSLEPTTEVSFLSAQHLSAVGADLTTAELLEAMGNAWSDIRAGSSFGGKAVLSLPEDAFWASGAKLPFKTQYMNERLGWKLSCLYSVNDHYGGVKVIGANAFNRNLGLPRSTSTILLLEKQTSPAGRPGRNAAFGPSDGKLCNNGNGVLSQARGTVGRMYFRHRSDSACHHRVSGLQLQGENHAIHRSRTLGGKCGETARGSEHVRIRSAGGCEGQQRVARLRICNYSHKCTQSCVCRR